MFKVNNMLIDAEGYIKDLHIINSDEHATIYSFTLFSLDNTELGVVSGTNAAQLTINSRKLVDEHNAKKKNIKKTEKYHEASLSMEESLKLNRIESSNVELNEIYQQYDKFINTIKTNFKGQIYVIGSPNEADFKIVILQTRKLHNIATEEKKLKNIGVEAKKLWDLCIKHSYNTQNDKLTNIEKGANPLKINGDYTTIKNFPCKIKFFDVKQGLINNSNAFIGYNSFFGEDDNINKNNKTPRYANGVSLLKQHNLNNNDSLFCVNLFSPQIEGENDYGKNYITFSAYNLQLSSNDHNPNYVIDNGYAINNIGAPFFIDLSNYRQGLIQFIKNIWDKEVINEKYIFDNYSILAYDDCGFGSELIKTISTNNSVLDETINTPSTKEKKDIDYEKLTNILGMPPTMGDLFKTIMCHLETFTAMVYGCANTIYSNITERIPEKLGVNIDNTSIKNLDLDPEKVNEYKSSNKAIPITPFPKLYIDKDQRNSCPINGDDDIQEETWPGEFDKYKWEEYKLVDSMFNKITSIYQTDSYTNINDNTESVGISLLKYPILPCDLTITSFPAYTCNSFSELSAYLAIRFSLYSMINYRGTTDSFISECDCVGKLDAYNFYDLLKTKCGGSDGAIQQIDKILKNVTNLDSSVTNPFKRIASCTCDDDNYKVNGKYVFENIRNPYGTVEQVSANNENIFYKNTKGHNPIIVLFGGDGEKFTKYSYMQFKGYGSTDGSKRLSSGNLYPIGDFSDFKKLGNSFPVVNDNGNIFNISLPKKNDNYYIDDNVFVGHNVNDYLRFLKENNKIDDTKNYINPLMFNIHISEGDKYGKNFSDNYINEVYSIYNGDKKIEVDKYSLDDVNQSKINENFFYKTIEYVSDEDYWKKYFLGNSITLLPTEESKIETDFSTNINNNIGYPNTFGKKKENYDYLIIDEKKEMKLVSKSTLPTAYSGNVGVIHFNTYIPTTTNYIDYADIKTEECSLFGCENYYTMSSTDKIDENNRDCAKAFLFLHTLKYWYSNRIEDYNPLFNSDGSVFAVPYGRLLIEGALAWRYEFYKEFKYDIFDYILGNPNDPQDEKCCGLMINTKAKEIIGEYKNSQFLFDTNYSRYSQNKHLGFNEVMGGYDQITINTLKKFFLDFVKGDWQTIKKTCELHDNDGNTINKEQFTALVKIFVECSNQNNGADAWDIIRGKTEINVSDGTKFTLSGIVGNYKYICPTDSKKSLILDMSEELSDFNTLINNIYLSKVIVSGYVNNLTSYSPTIPTESYIRYFMSFSSELKKVYDANNSVETQDGSADEVSTSDLERNVDLKFGIYKYVKNLWDRWLLYSMSENINDPITNNPFSVKNYFSSFIFCDSFYRNMYRMIVNMGDFAKSIEADAVTDSPKSLFSVIGDIAKDNKCMFFALPDIVDLGNPNINKALTNMSSMFKPYTWAEKKEIQQSNKFVIMHVYTDSGEIGDANNEVCDGFDIYSYDSGRGITKVAESCFRNIHSEKEKTYIQTHNLETTPEITNQDIVELQQIRYGYNVPSFGVTFSRQNNHIFKGINVNMDSPMQTEYSIKTYSDIVKKASGSTNHMCFYGQDLYPVFNNYSYTCEIEMLGNAQITPLMYFQLLNVPLFRGAYMIFRVDHTMQPGYMTTKIKGMKMSRRAPRYVDNGCVMVEGIGGVSADGTYGNGAYYIDTSWGVSYGCENDNVQNGILRGMAWKPADDAYLKDHTSGTLGERGRRVHNKPISEFTEPTYLGRCTRGVKQFLSGLTGREVQSGNWYGYSSFIVFEKEFVNGSNAIYELKYARCPEFANNPDIYRDYTDRTAFESWYINNQCKGDIMFMTHGFNPPCYGSGMENEVKNYREFDNSRPCTDTKTDNYGHGVWFGGYKGTKGISPCWVSDTWQNTAIPYNDGAQYWRIYRLKDCSGHENDVTTNIDESQGNTQNMTDTTKANGREILNQLLIVHKELGLTLVQAVGIAGVLGQESGWQPVIQSNKSSAWGIAQWINGDRKKRFPDFCKKSGGKYTCPENLTEQQIYAEFDKQLNTIAKQIDFLVYELTEVSFFTNITEVLGDNPNKTVTIEGNRMVARVGNIKSVSAPADNGDYDYEKNRAAIHDVVRRFLLGYENLTPGDEAMMVNRCAWAKEAWDIAMQYLKF